MIDHALLLQLAAMIATAGAIYGGIRTDLRHIRERLDRVERHLGWDATGERRRRVTDDR